MKPATRREVERLARERDRVFATLKELPDLRLAEMMRRNEETAQETGLSGSGAGGSAQKGSVSRPTEARALRAVDCRRCHGDQADCVQCGGTGVVSFENAPYDPTGDAIAQVRAKLREMGGLAKQIGQATAAIFNVGDSNYGRVSSLQGACNACGCDVSGVGNDRLRSGYCLRDYRRWVRVGRPDRVAFEHEVQSGSIETEAP